MKRIGLWWFLVVLLVFSLVMPTGAFAEESNTYEEEETTEENSSTPPYGPGDENKEIQLMKQDLTALGFGNFPAGPSERYGPVTQGVVAEFQEFYEVNAAEIGVADALTLQVIEELLNSPLQDRFEGPEAKELKMNLTKLGFGNFPADPSQVYGVITANVVRDFQAANNLPVSGIAEVSTLRTINTLLERLPQVPYRDGQAGEEIVTLKENLTTLGFGNFPSSPSDRYGNVTASVVASFQGYFGLEASGEADQAALDLIESILTSVYTDGTRDNDEVEQLKLDLTELGFGNFPSNPSGNYGPVTMGVVSEYQNANDLRVSGIADPVTLALIAAQIEEANRPLEVPYQNGDAGEEIVTLKQNLTTLGFGNFPSSPSDRYGQVTSSVVAAFQEYFGLEVSGEADQATLDYIQSILTSVYTDGIRGEDAVRDLKLHLTLLGFGNFPANPSGNYGPVTMGVVSDFQAANELVVSGIADPVTLALIAAQVEEANRPLEVPYQSGDEGDEIVTLKQNLSTLGFGNFPSSPSNRYGTVTTSVVADFQQYFGLDVAAAGDADQLTLDYISSILTSVYTDGTEDNADVRQLKLDLTALGYGTFPADPSGNYGPVTMRVVSAYQAANELRVSGIADPVTLALIAQQIVDQTPTLSLDIFHTNDMHAKINNFGKISAFIDEKGAEAENYLYLDAGDIFSGNAVVDLQNGAPIVDLLNNMDLTAMAIGNHEFDYGQEAFAEREVEAEFDWLSANMKVVDNEIPIKQPEPYQIYEIDGVDVGVFSLTQNPPATRLSGIEGIDFHDYVETAEQYAFLADETDILIALTHIGNSADKMLAEHVDFFDVIIGGHSHSRVFEADVVNGTPVVQAGGDAQFVGHFNLAFDGTDVTFNDYYLQDVSDLTNVDTEIQSMVDAYNAASEELLEEVVGITNTGLSRDARWARDTSLGNFWTDSMRQALNADIAITNNGGIRANIAPGEITAGDIYTVEPFGNELSELEITGADLRDVIEYSYSYRTQNDLQTSGLTYTIYVDENDQFVDADLFVDGAPIEDEVTYTLVTNNFMAEGGDGYDFSAATMVQPAAGYVTTGMFQLMDDLMTAEGAVDYADGEGRVSIEQVSVEADAEEEVNEESIEASEEDTTEENVETSEGEVEEEETVTN